MLARMKLGEDPLHDVEDGKPFVYDTDKMTLNEIKALSDLEGAAQPIMVAPLAALHSVVDTASPSGHGFPRPTSCCLSPDVCPSP